MIHMRSRAAACLGILSRVGLFMCVLCSVLALAPSHSSPSRPRQNEWTTIFLPPQPISIFQKSAGTLAWGMARLPLERARARHDGTRMPMAMTMAMTMTMTMESIAGTLAWGEQRLRHAECSARVPGGPVLRQSGRLRACRRLGPSGRIRENEGAG